MLRRCASLLLAPTVLLSQWGSLGHSHGSIEPAGHGSALHFHFSFFSWHDQDDDDDHDDTCCGDQEAMCNERLSPIHDHDADAVYLPGLAILGSQDSDTQCPSNAWWTGGAWNVALVSDPDPTRQVPKLSHHPPLIFEACPIYLRTLSLLI